MPHTGEPGNPVQHPKYQPQPMEHWFDPRRLAVTSIRVAISTIFGEFADRREGMSVGRDDIRDMIDSVFRYEEEGGGLWFDFVADAGDGWAPTYAIARLLAREELVVDGHTLKRGRFLIMGGDQVYPTASRSAYAKKLVSPYHWAALKETGAENLKNDGKDVDLFVLPGNHDWYDGLSSFMGLFCASRKPLTQAGFPLPGRPIGGRRTHQARSYFALKLPHNYWLWGADAQLSGYIDQAQIAFFTHAANNWMDQGSRIILCTAEPAWAYSTPEPTDEQEERFTNFAFLERLAVLTERKHEIVLVLTGDAHHYSRYVEEERNYITAGGGGAFLHPTHNLDAEKIGIGSRFPPPGQEKATPPYQRNFTLATNRDNGKEALYPDRETSRSLASRNWKFLVRNWEFAATLFALFLFFNWLMASNAQILNQGLVNALTTDAGRASVLASYFQVYLTTPWPLLATLLAMAGCAYFADYPRWRQRFALGAAHFLAHAVVVVLTLILVARLFGPGSSSALAVFVASLLAAALSSTIFGLYLYLSLERLKVHWNEAFSALREEGYKNFLRLHIAKDGTLTLYPIGLDAVPACNKSGNVPDAPPLEPHLIEHPIRAAGPKSAPAGDAEGTRA